MSAQIQELQDRLDSLIQKSKSLKTQAFALRGTEGFTAEKQNAILAQRPTVKTEIARVREEISQLSKTGMPDMAPEPITNSSESGITPPLPQLAIPSQLNFNNIALLLGGVIVLGIVFSTRRKKKRG